MGDAVAVDRLHFAFTATFHYIFPQLTMGLALLLLILKSLALWTKNDEYNRAVRFWARIFALNFALGVVTGVPMEFQFGTNWAAFSRASGGVIGQTLAMEGMFSFFLESSFLGLMLFGEKRLGPKGHWASVFLVWLGSWMSGFFIIATNAWMQHPVAYSVAADGSYTLSSLWGLLLNPWAFWQYNHNMLGAVQTGCFVMAAISAYYLLMNRFEAQARLFLRVSVITVLIAACLQLFPTGDQQGVMIARYQQPTLAGMEGVFKTEKGVPLAILGQPDVQNRRLDNPLEIPRALSFLTYRAWTAEVKGLDSFPQSEWPDRISVLYYSYHVMVGLGTIFIAIAVVAAFLLWRGNLYSSRWMLWILLLSFPFPFIANTAGWITAEVGRQPYLVYGLMRTPAGISPLISEGNAWFTLIGFMGMYMVLGILFLFLMYREIEHGPEPVAAGN